MRVSLLWAVLCCAALAGCSRGDCLPEPPSDATPPSLRLTVFFTEPTTGRPDSLTITDQDADRALEADEAGEVVVAYEGIDDEGMRRLHLGLTIHQSVGVGIQSKTPRIEPVTASCPRRRLAGRMPVVGGSGRRTLSLSLAAENWAGLRAHTETLVVRLYPAEAG